MVSTDHVAKSVPNRTSAKKIHMGCYHRRGVAFFRELEQEEILTKSTFYEESKHPLSTGHPQDFSMYKL